MKKIAILTIVFLSIFSFGTFAQSKGYEIRVKFKNLKDTSIYLGFHFGNTKYIKDTTRVNSKGLAVFKDIEPLASGVYLIIIPSKNYFELIVNENLISVETDTVEMVENMKVLVSEENKKFYDYLHFMKDIYDTRTKYAEELKLHKNNRDSTDLLNAKIKSVDDSIEKYRKNVQIQYPNLFFAKLLKMMEDPEPREKLPNEADSIYGDYLYTFYQQHFFDNIDFSDSAILRTPIYEAKIDKYLDRLTMKNPDSIACSSQRLLDKTLANREVFKFTLIKLFNKAAQSKYMGMDVVVYHLAKRYYLSGLAYWADSAQKAKLNERIWNMENNIIGMKAKELIMKDTNDNYKSLLSTKAIYTILIFWDVTCSHCRHSIPILRDYYNRTNHDSVQVFSVYIGNDLPEWKKYIRENNLNWINVSDPFNFSNFRQYFDVYQTPVIYILDSKKSIQAKKIGVEDIEGIIKILNTNPIPDYKDNCPVLPAPKPTWK